MSPPANEGGEGVRRTVVAFQVARKSVHLPVKRVVLPLKLSSESLLAEAKRVLLHLICACERKIQIKNTFDTLLNLQN